MSDYTEFFLNNSGKVIQFETLEITHPDFTQPYRVVRNATQGLTATYEDSVAYSHDYYPLQIKSQGSKGDLDYGFSIILGDLGEVLPTEIDSISSADGFSVKPTVKYRTFRSDDLTKPMFGPLVLQVTTFSFAREGSSFDATAPQVNINKTGEYYTVDRIPMLRGFL